VLPDISSEFSPCSVDSENFNEFVAASTESSPSSAGPSGYRTTYSEVSSSPVIVQHQLQTRRIA
jgi:hypothetical protein